MGDFPQKGAEPESNVKSHLVFTPLGTKSQNDQVGPEAGAAPSAGSRPLPAVIFTHWREALNQARLSPAARGGYTLAIASYLDYCRRNGLSVTLESARGFVSDAQRRQLARNPQLWKEALNWFFREGRLHSALRPTGVPSAGQADTGRTPWERRLIERLRLNHYSWRTEQTYREWAWRFAQFLGHRDLESATGEDLKAMYGSGLRLTEPTLRPAPAPPCARYCLPASHPGGGAGGPSQQTRDPALPASQFCNASPGIRHRYPHGPGPPGACRCGDDTNLHPRHGQARPGRAQSPGPLEKAGLAGTRLGPGAFFTTSKLTAPVSSQTAK